MASTRLAAAAIALVLTTGCSSVRLGGQVARHEQVELDSVPFFPQTIHHCGPAALAEMLGASGVAVDPDGLTPEVYVPGLHGSLQPELAAAARRHGRMAYVIRPTLDALIAELDAGHPVLVLQNFGLPSVPAWHYAVVIGYDRPRDQVLLRSGTQRRDAVATGRFDATWRRADRWALVVLRPEDIPAGAAAVPWLAAAGELQATSGAAIAAPGYAAAVRRWPDEPLAWFAQGNARLAVGDVDGAEAAFAAVLLRQPRHAPARNNLALLLARRGCVALARAQIERAALDASGTALAGEVADSAREINARPGSDSRSCPGSDTTY